ncbi:MAG: hypothetical protein RLZZ579_107, partial [Actinomycetota bacterium]
MTKKFAVLGKPINHSKSPIIHSTIFSILGIDATYQAIELGDGLPEFLRSHTDFTGFSITMPLKDQAFAISQDLDEAARATRSVNTLLRYEDGWNGFNTDTFGIQMALKDADLSSVLVIGTGATARSAIVALRALSSNVKVWGRNQESSGSLAMEFSVEVAGNIAEASKSSAVVSTLPALALDGLLFQIVNPIGTLLDVAYHPWPSRAAEYWVKSGKAISGIE